MEERYNRKPRLAEIMDNIIFTWVDEIPIPQKGRGGRNARHKWIALMDLAKSNPEHVIRLEMFFDIKVQYMGTSFHKFLKTYHPAEMKHFDFATRREGIDSQDKPIFVFYIAYYEEEMDDE